MPAEAKAGTPSRGSRPVDEGREDLPSKLRLIVITDRSLAAPRTVEVVVLECLAAGARAIQLRDKSASSRDLLDQARILRQITLDWGALLFVNDRFDVALAAGADGVHLGPDDLPVASVRAVAPQGFLVGHSTDQPDRARQAVADGADYIGCGAVFPTTTKKDAGKIIGLTGLAQVTSAVTVPVVGIGGVTPGGAREIARTSSASGVAVIASVMAAENPGGVVRELLAPFEEL